MQKRRGLTIIGLLPPELQVGLEGPAWRGLGFEKGKALGNVGGEPTSANDQEAELHWQ